MVLAQTVSVYQVICSQRHSRVSRFASVVVVGVIWVTRSTFHFPTVAATEESHSWMRINGAMLSLFNNLRIKIGTRVDNSEQLDEAAIDAQQSLSSKQRARHKEH